MIKEMGLWRAATTEMATAQTHITPPPLAALLIATFGGQYAGDAIASVVLGTTNPAGRLTTSWYTRAAEAGLGSIGNYAMTNRTYRFAPEAAMTFPFGHGTPCTPQPW